MPPSRIRGTQCQSLSSYTASPSTEITQVLIVQWDTDTPPRPPTLVGSAKRESYKHDPPQSKPSATPAYGVMLPAKNRTRLNSLKVLVAWSGYNLAKRSFL
ncbi:hypothetical protein BD770DRAFT_439085 [Pilaira anomala]|nr:hypothetical protein BD770DRAFT_439085 [Pilaira anomala]